MLGNPTPEYDHYMVMMPLLNPERAQMTVDDQGGITVDDPESPLLVTIRLDADHRICHLVVTTRHPSGRITNAGLSRLPLAQIQRLAAAIQTITPDEAWWTAAASLKPAGSRNWPDEHWSHVLAVAAWATTINRRGGAVRAIADLWGVACRPTAYRWLAEARRRAISCQHQDSAGNPSRNHNADCADTGRSGTTVHY